MNAVDGWYRYSGNTGNKGDIPKNCTTCAFQYKCNKGKSMWCALKKFVILNPEVGCSRHMTKGEFKSKNCFITAEERQAAAEAQYDEGS